VNEVLAKFKEIIDNEKSKCTDKNIKEFKSTVSRKEIIEDIDDHIFSKSTNDNTILSYLKNPFSFI
jgi:predicted transcriptional regulator